MADQDHPPSTHGPRFPLDAAVAFVFGTLFSGNIGRAAYSAITNGEWVRGFGEMAGAVVIGVGGISFSWWRKFLAQKLQKWIREEAWKWWVPIGVIVLFAYAVAPEAYKRATTSSHLSPAVSAAPTTEPTGDALKQAQATANQLGIANNELQLKLNTATTESTKKDQALTKLREERDKLQQIAHLLSPGCAFDLKRHLTTFEQFRGVPRSLVVITSELENGEENQTLKRDIGMVIDASQGENEKTLVQVPDPKDEGVHLDAPKLTSTGLSGITVHGSGSPARYLFEALDTIFFTHTASAPEQDLLGYYSEYYSDMYKNKAPDGSVVWVEIETGPLLKPSVCQ
jgi:hypothetical protein